MTATGDSPQFSTLINGSAGGQALVLRYRSDEVSRLRIFWEDTTGGYSGSHSSIYSIPASPDQWSEVTLPFECEGELRALRLDPKITSDHPLEIDSLVLRRL